MADGAALAFQHRQSAHCESGVVANLLTHSGLPMSEPMAFGLSSSLVFAYIPVVKMAGLPLIAYRMPPGNVIRGVEKRLGMKWVRRTFSDAAEGQRALDAELANGRAVGMQTCVYWLPYFPEDMRFHFNAHNLVAYGRHDGDYLISDPVFEGPSRCDGASLQKARFAKGVMAAHGLMYYPDETPREIDYARAIPGAISRNYKYMTKAPLPVIGANGIRFLGRTIARLGADPRRREKYLPAFLGHIVRMQEEIGTGGAGFRFLYASFLQESAKLLRSDLLAEASSDLTDAGDEWRRFALHATKMCRGRMTMDAAALGALLDDIATRELAVWKTLRRLGT
jgi:hypothetical protein